MRWRARITLALTLTVFGCRADQIAVPESEPPANVLIVMVDTLRADHMSLYGYERTTTPFIDRFAADSEERLSSAIPV